MLSPSVMQRCRELVLACILGMVDGVSFPGRDNFNSHPALQPSGDGYKVCCSS